MIDLLGETGCTYVGVYVGANGATCIARWAVVAAIVAVLEREEGDVDSRGRCREAEENEGLHRWEWNLCGWDVSKRSLLIQ